MDASGKTALVLSAGGMFGAYQAGVWDVLADRFQPDLVIGASVGSLNGYLIAGGVPPGDLIESWLSLESVAAVRWRFSPRFTRGLVDATNLESLVRDVCRRAVPKCEYAVVATESRGLRPRIFRWPQITWEHIAASCGVPLILPTYRIEGKAYWDGGLVDPSPVWAALELGATHIVSINVMRWRPWFIRTAVAAVRRYSGYSPPDTTGVSLIEINPRRPLGPPRDAMYWDRGNIERWIDAGRQDADTHRKHFDVECFDRRQWAEVTGIGALSHLSIEGSSPATIPLGPAYYRSHDGQT